MIFDRSSEEVAKERAIERLREHGLTPFEGEANETKTCEICGSEETRTDIIKEAVQHQGNLMIVAKCVMCMATEIERNELRDDDKLSAKLK